MDISAIALDGLQRADAQLNQTAARIASFGTEAGQDDSVDLSAEMVALITIKNQTSVDVAALKTGEDIQKTLLDILA
jgi:hypothetical protein